MTGHPEAVLEREVLRVVGRIPDVLLLRNEVGLSYRGALLPALQRELTPYGREVVAGNRLRRASISASRASGVPSV